MSLATVQHSTALPSTKVDTGPRYAPDPQIKSPAKQDTQLPVSSPPPTWLADVNAKSRVEFSVNAFLDTLDPALKQLIQDDINYVGGISQFLSAQSLRNNKFTEADVSQSVSVALECATDVKINAISPQDFDNVISNYSTYRSEIPLVESKENKTKRAQIDALLRSKHHTKQEKEQVLASIFNDTTFNQPLPNKQPLPKSVQAAVQTARTQKMLQNTCHFRTFLGLFSANQTAIDRAQAAIDTVVDANDAENDNKEQAKALLQAIIDNDLNAYAIAFHQFKANIQYADVAEGQQSSPSSSIELANRAYQVLMGARETHNLFGEIVETNTNGRSQTINAVIQLAVPDRDQSLTDLVGVSAITGDPANSLINRYRLSEGSNHVILSIPRVYITEAGRAQKNTSSIDINWDPIEIDGQDYTPVAIGVHYGVSANGGHHESYTPGTPITADMKKGLEYVVLQKVDA